MDNVYYSTSDRSPSSDSASEHDVDSANRSHSESPYSPSNVSPDSPSDVSPESPPESPSSNASPVDSTGGQPEGRSGYTSTEEALEVNPANDKSDISFEGAVGGEAAHDPNKVSIQGADDGQNEEKNPADDEEDAHDILGIPGNRLEVMQIYMAACLQAIDLRCPMYMNQTKDRLEGNLTELVEEIRENHAKIVSEQKALNELRIITNLRNASIHKLTRSQVRTGLMCSVCTKDFVVHDSAVIISCNHMSHVNCMIEWLKKNTKCPICRLQMQFHGPAGTE